MEAKNLRGRWTFSFSSSHTQTLFVCVRISFKLDESPWKDLEGSKRVSCVISQPMLCDITFFRPLLPLARIYDRMAGPPLFFPRGHRPPFLLLLLLVQDMR